MQTSSSGLQPIETTSGLDQAPGGIYPHAIYWWRASAIRSSSVASSGSSSARKYASNSACSSPSVGSDGTGLAMGCRSHRVRLRCTCWSRPRRDGWFGMRVWWPRQSWRFLLVVSGTSTPSGSARGSVRPGRGEHVANGRQSRGARPSRRTSAVMSAGIAYPTPPGGRGQFALQEANSHRPPSRRCRGDPRSADQSALCAGPVRPGPPLRGRSGADEPPCGTPSASPVTTNPAVIGVEGEGQHPGRSEAKPRWCWWERGRGGQGRVGMRCLG